MTLVRRIARPMLSAVFVVEGFGAIQHPSKKLPKAAPFLDKVGPMLHLPDDPELLVRLNGIAQVAGGLMLATGKLPRVGAVLIVGSMVPTTIAGHAFWEIEDPVQRRAQLTQFLKNVGLIGGALLAAVDTAGKPGVAWRARNYRNVTERQAKYALKTARREVQLAQKDAQLKLQEALH